MVVLVRCIDNTVSVALASRVEILIAEGLITAYLTSDGWMEARSKNTKERLCNLRPKKQRYAAFVSCF